MSARANTPIWLWLNILSLDGAIVALVWQDFLVRCYPVLIRSAARWVLGLTVWAIYLADRLLDARHPAAPNETARHRFYRKHRAGATMLLILVLLADLLTADLALRNDLLLNGLFILAGVLFYLTLFAAFRIGVSCKHPSAAVLFTIGVFLVAWTRTPTPVQTLSWPAIVFCALCLGNLVMLENWEQGRVRTRLSFSKVWIWMTILIAVCTVLRNPRWYGAVAASALGLAVLDLLSDKLDTNLRHVLADAVLLTPLFFR